MVVTSRKKSETDKFAFLFRELPDYTENVGTDWNLFKSAVITSAFASYGCERVGGQMDSEKKAAWLNQKVKEAIRVTKTAFRAWLTIKSSEQLRLRYSATRTTPATIVKEYKKNSCEEFGQKLDKIWTKVKQNRQ